jgi:hypothetical protein
MPAPTVMDAINEALGVGDSSDGNSSGEGTDSGTDSGDTGDGDAAATGDSADGDAAAGTETDGEEGDAGAGDGEEAGAEGEAAGAASNRRADGTFKSKEEIAAEKAAATGKPGADAAAAAAGAKKPDALNDPIPKELKQETQERIRTLITTTKEATTRAEKAETDFNYLIQGVQATGATPEQYGETLSWLAMFNSNDPAQQTKALELVESVADRLATLLGKERTVGDPMAEHADLKEAVAKGQVTAQYAKEIARTRNSSKFRNDLTSTARTEAEQAQAHTQALAQAKADLNALETQLRKDDPQYEQKKAIIVPMLKPVFEQLEPSKWKAAFAKAFAGVKVSAPVKKIPANQPMRAGKQPSGGQKTAPGSMLDAVNGALAGMR